MSDTSFNTSLIGILSDSERLIHTFNLGQPQQQQPGEGGRGGKPGSPGPLEQPGQLILSSMHSQGRRKREFPKLQYRQQHFPYTSYTCPQDL